MDYAAEPAKKKLDGAALAQEGGKWIERIKSAERREDQWRKDAKAAEKAFAADEKVTDGVLYDFNILHSNVETIVPAIYNSTPIPDVRRRWTESIGEPPQDPTQQILMQAAQQANIPPEQAQQMMQTEQGKALAQQALQSPPARQAFAQFQQAMQAYQAKAQRDRDTKDLGDLIERGITVQIDDNKLDKEIEKQAQDAFLSGRAIIRVKFDAQAEGEEVTGERFDFEAVSWRDFRMGQATRWPNVPWVAFRHVVPRETAELEHTDKEVYEAQPQTDYDKNPGEGDDVCFWEIWCKYDKSVKFVREHDSKILKITEDPLGLSGFYPCPEPVQPITLTGRMTPVCPFTIYKKLADELDTITKRINAIMKGLRVRGLVPGMASKILDMSLLGDNELAVDSDLESLAQLGVDKAVLWWPVEQAIKVLKELYAQREIVKASIYEITGISDIIRGASNANETLGAQEIKTQWGALRIQKMQRMIARQVRDVFGMMAELICSGKFSDKTLYEMTAIEITDGMRALMQQPVLTSYRVDVESDSTVRADLTRQKQDMTEFVTGSANYFKTMGPLMASAPEAAEPIIEIFSAMASVFKLGRKAEDALERLGEIAKKAASQPRPNPEAEKAKAEMAIKKQEADDKAADRKAEMAMKSEEHQMKRAESEQEMAFKREVHAMTKELEALKVRVAQIQAGIKVQEANIDLQTTQAEGAIKLQSAEQQAQVKAEAGRQSVEQAREMGAIKAAQAKKPEKADA